MSEADQSLLDAVKPIAHEANVPAGVLSAFVVGFKELEAQIVSEHTAELEKHMAETVDELRKEWGKDYDPNILIANRAMKDLGGDDMVAFLNETEAKDGGILANHPQMVRLFAGLGRKMSEDGVIMPVDTTEAKDMEGRIDDLTNKAFEALSAGNGPLADKLYKERSALSERLYGDEPIGGAM